MNLDPQFRTLSQNFHQSKYCSGNISFESLTAGDIASDELYEQVIRQTVKRELAKAKIPSHGIQVSLKLPEDPSSNTVTWHCKVEDGSAVDFAKVRSVLADSVGTLSLADSLNEFTEVCAPKLKSMKVTDIALSATGTDPIHLAGSAKLSTVNLSSWKANSRVLKAAINDALNTFALEAMGEELAKEVKLGFGLQPVTTGLSFTPSDGGGLQLDWNFDHSVMAQSPNLKTALESFNDVLKTPAGMKKLTSMFKDLAWTNGVPRTKLTRSEFTPVIKGEGSQGGQVPIFAGADKQWTTISGGFDAKSLRALKGPVLGRAAQDLLTGMLWKRGLNVPRSLVSVVASDDGAIHFNIRVPDNSLSAKVKAELEQLVAGNPANLVNRLKVCVADQLQLEADDDSEALGLTKLSREQCKKILAGALGEIKPIDNVERLECTGLVTVGGMRSRVMAEHLDSLKGTMSELCFQHGINARFKVEIDKSVKSRRGQVKLKYEATTDSAFHSAQVHELLKGIFSGEGRKDSSADGLEFVEAFKKRVERTNGTDSMLALQRLKLVQAEATTKQQLDEMENTELTPTQPFKSNRRSRRSGKESKTAKARSPTDKLVKASELVSSAPAEEEEDEATVARVRRRRNRAARRAASREGTGDDEAASERRRRRGERRRKRESKKKTAEELETERREALVKAKEEEQERAKAEGPTLDGVFAVSGIDHDEVTPSVKKHMVTAMLSTLVGLEVQIEAENIKIKNVTGLRNGNVSIDYTLNIPGVKHDDPVVQKAVAD